MQVHILSDHLIEYFTMTGETMATTNEEHFEKFFQRKKQVIFFSFLGSVLLESVLWIIMNCWCQGSNTRSHTHILDIYWYPNKFQYSDHKVVNNISCRSESSNLSLVVRSCIRLDYGKRYVVVQSLQYHFISLLGPCHRKKYSIVTKS